VTQFFPPAFVEVRNPHPIPEINSFVAFPDPVTVNRTTSLNVSASVGNGTLSYSYLGLPPGCASSNVSSLTCIPIEIGNFTVRVFVNDPMGQSANSTMSLIVNPAISITSFTATPNPVLAGTTTTLNVSASGGKPPYSYAYIGLPDGCAITNSAAISCNPITVLGREYNVTVFVNDTAGNSANSTLSLWVSVLPDCFGLCSFTASPSTFTYGNSTILGLVGFFGPGPLNITYTGLPAGCASSSFKSLTCTPIVTGLFHIRVFVNESGSGSFTSTVAIEVNPSIGPVIFSFIASPSTLEAGRTTMLTVVAAGGTPPYAYRYAGLPVGCYSANQSALACRPTSAGTYNVTVTVMDSAGLSAIRDTTLTVTVFQPLTFSVMFMETGLLSQTNWSVALNGVLRCSTTDMIAFTELNGTYLYSVGGIPGWAPSSHNGSVEVNGSGTSATIRWSQITYSVIFTETGLPSGTNWYLNLSGPSEEVSLEINTSIANVILPNGTYLYNVATTDTGYAPNPTNFSFKVSGGDMSEHVTFSLTAPQPTPAKGQGNGVLGLPGAQGFAVLGIMLATAAIVGIEIALLLWWRESGEEGEDPKRSTNEGSPQGPDENAQPEPPESPAPSVPPPGT
jgi:hypothetical protein